MTGHASTAGTGRVLERRRAVALARHDREWRDRHGRLPSSYDWLATHVRRGGGEALEQLAQGGLPPASVVTHLFGSWGSLRVRRPRAMTAAAGERVAGNELAVGQQLGLAA